LWQQGVGRTDVPIAWVACQLIDHTAHLQHGVKNFRMWQGKADPIGTCCQNLLQMNPPILFVEFLGQPNGCPVVYPSLQSAEPYTDIPKPTEKENERIKELVQSGIVSYKWSSNERRTCWNTDQPNNLLSYRSTHRLEPSRQGLAMAISNHSTVTTGSIAQGAPVGCMGRLHSSARGSSVAKALCKAHSYSGS